MDNVLVCVKCGAEVDVIDAHYDSLGNPICWDCACRSRHHDRIDEAWETQLLGFNVCEA